MVNGLSKIEALQVAVESALNVVNESKAGYRVGVYNNFKVLDAVQKLFSSRRDYVKARYESLLQAMRLKASAGMLVEQDLMDVNNLLEEGGVVKAQ